MLIAINMLMSEKKRFLAGTGLIYIIKLNYQFSFNLVVGPLPDTAVVGGAAAPILVTLYCYSLK